MMRQICRIRQTVECLRVRSPIYKSAASLTVAGTAQLDHYAAVPAHSEPAALV
jgi:hypothetical protein